MVNSVSTIMEGLAPLTLRRRRVDVVFPVLQPERVNKAATSLAVFDADYFIIANYQQILARQVFDLPRRFTINFHPSLLPAYAGLWPFFWMAQNHERERVVFPRLP